MLRIPAFQLTAAVIVIAASVNVHAQGDSASNLALHARVTSSSVLRAEYPGENAVDGVVSDTSRWVSGADDFPAKLELDLGAEKTLRCAHVYSGWEDGSAMKNFAIEAWRDNNWQPIAGGSVKDNTSLAVEMIFEAPITARRIRLASMDKGPARLRELALFASVQPLGTGVKIDANSLTAVFPTNQHLIAVNQVGYETGMTKRFTAPQSPDGSAFEIVRAGGSKPLFHGMIKNHAGDFTEFKPADSTEEYVIAVSGKGVQEGTSDPFAIRSHLWREQFWPAAVDFMIDARSVVGTHPSAYGGCPWRDGTYYAFEVPSLVFMYLADPGTAKSLPVQMNWGKDKERVLSPEFKFDTRNPESEGVMDAVKKYYTELEPPKAGAPDVAQLIHWGLGFYLFKPESRDPSSGPTKREIHGQTVEQFAYLLYAWPKLKEWLPEDFYKRCEDFAFSHWKDAGLLEVDPAWNPKGYHTPGADESFYVDPYKGRHAPGHEIQPNLMMYEVAKREGRADARIYLQSARQATEWLIKNLDWKDPRTTKAHRMSEYKTMTGLVWYLQNYPDEAPAGLQGKIEDWARLMIELSDNMWDFRRYDMGENWTIPKLNETGNLVSFTASALAASWVVKDAAMKTRLKEIAIAQSDNVFGRNPRFAAAPHHPEKGFPLIERGWPKGQPDNTCARLEMTRGSLSASPGSEMYPFNPGGAYRHPEGWVNYNAAWDVALAYLKWDDAGRAP